jgi:hypothetical protein
MPRLMLSCVSFAVGGFRRKDIGQTCPDPCAVSVLSWSKRTFVEIEPEVPVLELADLGVQLLLAQLRQLCPTGRQPTDQPATTLTAPRTIELAVTRRQRRLMVRQELQQRLELATQRNRRRDRLRTRRLSAPQRQLFLAASARLTSGKDCAIAYPLRPTSAAVSIDHQQHLWLRNGSCLLIG